MGQPRTLEHSNLIEGLWANLQRKLKMIYAHIPGNSAAIKDFIYEAMWRLELEALPLDQHLEFVKLATDKHMNRVSD